MKAWITTAALAISVAVGAAAPAAADENGYLRQLQDKYAFLSTQQLLAEGHKVCQTIDRGTLSTDATKMVQKDLTVPVAVADDIVSTAAVQLGC